MPIDEPLNLTTQSVLTFGSWGITLILLIVTIRMGIKERTPFYTLIVLAAGVAAFAEPLYDHIMMLYFYSEGGMWTHFTSFETPQPNWTHSGYITLYAVPAVHYTWRIRQGMLARQALYGIVAVEFLFSAIFEMYGINGGAYEYYGPHVLRIFEYPLICGLLECTQVACFAVGAAYLRTRVKSNWGLLGLFALFPATFYLANAGAGGPVAIALHLDDPKTGITLAATILSMVLAFALIRGASLFLPRITGEDSAMDDPRDPLGAHAQPPLPEPSAPAPTAPEREPAGVTAATADRVEARPSVVDSRRT
ncbi:MAG: hypothetical protein M0P31_16625 [Solirubrobacteraceae bacterium]|nr:hypothetical protein [Solirubrobacteraceae bacterium]